MFLFLFPKLRNYKVASSWIGCSIENVAEFPIFKIGDVKIFEIANQKSLYRSSRRPPQYKEDGEENALNERHQWNERINIKAKRHKKVGDWGYKETCQSLVDNIKTLNIL